MKFKFARKTARACLMLSVVLGISHANADSLLDGDAAAGKTRAMICSACHGAEGNSVTTLWPNLAGQNANYTFAQLVAFKDGKRPDPTMMGQAMALSEQDAKNLAVYFESLPAAAQSVADSDRLVLARAEALYRGGNAEDGIPACLACHGPTGRGNPGAAYPAVNGQHADYTAKQLADYASGARQSDGVTEIMRTIAERLNQDDIQALASYMQGLK